MKILYRISPFTFVYRFNHDLNSLKRCVNMYAALLSSYRNKFSAEINFLNNKAEKDTPWSFMFPYSFVLNYDHNKVRVHKDDNKGLFYVIHNGRRLYYSRQYQTESDVKKAYTNILIEQDLNSPHRYLTGKFNVKENDIIVDIGAGEGNFSLDVVETAGSLYLCETDIIWIEALNATFEPWKNKVRIINKFISDKNNDTSATLDHLLGESRIDFIKMDVEGTEMRVLNGSEKVIKNNPSLKMLICAYHRKNDAKDIARFLAEHKFTYEYSDGYMLFIYDTLTPPYFRKTLIKAEKNIS